MVWASFWYQYGIGGLIFVIGLYYTVRQGQVGLARGPKRSNLLMLVGGFAFMFFLQLAFMLLGAAG